MEMERRRREERSRSFVPVKPSDPNAFDVPSNDQYGFLHSDADERWAFGGNRSGKTEVAVQDCDMFCRGVHPVRSKYRKPPVKVRYCAPKWLHNIELVVLQKFREVAQRHELKGGSWQKAWSEKRHTLYYANGSTVTFKSFEEDLNTYGGADLDAVYQDEHGLESYYKENKARLTDRNGFFVSAMTPEMGVTWEDDHVTGEHEGLAIDYWFFTVFGNPHLSPDGVKQFRASIKDPMLAQAKLYGQFVALSGLVLPQWDENIHMVPDFTIPLHWPRIIVGDFHHRTPSAVIWAAWSPKGEFIVYRTAKEKLTVPEWKRYIRAKSGAERFSLYLSDEPGSGEAGGKNIDGKESICRQFNDSSDGHGVIPFIQAEKGPGTFDAGIYRLWDYLSVDPISQKSKVKVFKSCDHDTKIIDGKPCGSIPWEMKRYQYKREQKADEESLREKVRSTHCHYIDDMRYGISAGPQFVTGEITSPLTENWG